MFLLWDIVLWVIIANVENLQACTLRFPLVMTYISTLKPIKLWCMCTLLCILCNNKGDIIWNALRSKDIYSEIHVSFTLVRLMFPHYGYWQCRNCTQNLRMTSRFSSKSTKFIHILSCTVIVRRRGRYLILQKFLKSKQQ